MFTVYHVSGHSFIYIVVWLSLKLNNVTFRWKVPSNAATMTTFPRPAISSENSTMSGNLKVKLE